MRANLPARSVLAAFEYTKSGFINPPLTEGSVRLLKFMVCFRLLMGLILAHILRVFNNFMRLHYIFVNLLRIRAKPTTLHVAITLIVF